MFKKIRLVFLCILVTAIFLIALDPHTAGHIWHHILTNIGIFTKTAGVHGPKLRNPIVGSKHR